MHNKYFFLEEIDFLDIFSKIIYNYLNKIYCKLYI